MNTPMPGSPRLLRQYSGQLVSLIVVGFAVRLESGQLVGLLVFASFAGHPYLAARDMILLKTGSWLSVGAIWGPLKHSEANSCHECVDMPYAASHQGSRFRQHGMFAVARWKILISVCTQ